MIWRHAFSVPRAEKVTDNAVIRFIAIRSDGMMICFPIVPVLVAVWVWTGHVISGKHNERRVWSVKNHQSYAGDPGVIWCDYPPSPGAAQSLVTDSSSVVVMVGLLGAAMMASKVVQSHYSVPPPSPIQWVWCCYSHPGLIDRNTSMTSGRWIRNLWY